MWGGRHAAAAGSWFLRESSSGFVSAEDGGEGRGECSLDQCLLFLQECGGAGRQEEKAASFESGPVCTVPCPNLSSEA